MKKPIVVLIADVHYNINTLEIADKAMNMAVDKANELDVPLVVAGDMHDSKANLRGECIYNIIKTFKRCLRQPYVLRGNHCAINEKSKDHSLHFLQDLAWIVDGPYLRFHYDIPQLNLHLIPYYHDANELRQYLQTIPEGSTLIMHQGIIGSEAGHYIQDKSAITKQDVAGFRVISGHYHNRQTLELPNGGTFDYIGNPYTLGFGEAEDREKGFQVLYADGSLEFIPTNLRRHRIVEFTVKDKLWYTKNICLFKNDDLVWAKVTGSEEDLAIFNRESVAEHLGITNFRLTIEPIKTTTSNEEKPNLTDFELLDHLIDSSDTSDDQKLRLKNLWKTLNEGN